ncbi:MAG: thioredoxin domain-containing protein, partial [Proteobacteria bacterium]|nr:thioredoxin domain-containing protein [Pseudomonadota bacterium]
FAQDLTLDTTTFRSDFDSSETASFIMNDKLKGEEAGVHSTPSIFVNGFKMDFWPDLKEVLDCLFGYRVPTQD